MLRKSLRKSILMGLGVIVASGLLSSCSYEYEPSNLNNGMLAKAPKMVAYSGQHYWNNVGTRSADPNNNMWENVPTNITEEERDRVMNWFSTHQYPESISLDWTDFYVQQLGYSEWECTAEDGFNKYIGKKQMNQLAAGKEGQPDEINNFNANTAFNAIMKMVNSSTENFSYKQASGNGTRWYDKFVIVYIDGEYYVGFDFVSDGQNPNERVKADGYYNDWIVKITSAYPKEETPETPDPETPEDELCDICGDKKHGDGECPNEDCSSEVCHPNGSSNTDEPTTPGDSIVNGIDEVEINLALDKKNDNLLESHLSMHVRSTTDVEVFIPVPAQYYCEADDMAIVMNHGEFVHGGPIQTKYEIGDNIVQLIVSFEKDGIRVTTDGINEEVINYCWENYQDGITFEIWNYFNDPAVLEEFGIEGITMEELKKYLDKSIVEFLDKIPDIYVNAFGKDNGKYSKENNTDGKDFHVTPVDDQKGAFDEAREGLHLNGSDKNDIYNNKTGPNQD